MATSVSDQYFAGLFDGEGCVSMSLARSGYLSVVVKVTMCDRAPVHALYARFDGYFSDGKQRTHTGRNIYTWAVYNADSVEALELFSTLCMVKNSVAKAALPIALHMRDNAHRGALTQEEKTARIAAAEFIASINKPVGYRRVLDKASVDAYMEPKTKGGGKRVRLSDGREFNTLSEAASAIGVTVSAVSIALRKQSKTKGLTVELV